MWTEVCKWIEDTHAIILTGGQLSLHEWPPTPQPTSKPLYSNEHNITSIIISVRLEAQKCCKDGECWVFNHVELINSITRWLSSLQRAILLCLKARWTLAIPSWPHQYNSASMPCVYFVLILLEYSLEQTKWKFTLVLAPAPYSQPICWPSDLTWSTGLYGMLWLTDLWGEQRPLNGQIVLSEYSGSQASLCATIINTIYSIRDKGCCGNQ